MAPGPRVPRPLCVSRIPRYLSGSLPVRHPRTQALDLGSCWTHNELRETLQRDQSLFGGGDQPLALHSIYRRNHQPDAAVRALHAAH